ncbi:MAG: hypothetical protein JXA13_15675 [Anaerolineales bacterium]|nr:hypothetical protein [Anaerolineales bacterium]
MNPIATLLTESPGNLIYHLMLIYSVANTLRLSFTNWRQTGFPQVKREVLGLAILILAQLLLFSASGIVTSNILPPLDRALVFFSLLIITWLWSFPEPSRTADIATVIVAILVIFGSALSLLVPNDGAAYNSTIVNLLWQLSTIFFIAAALVLLIFRHPNGWGDGVAFLSVALLGHVVSLWYVWVIDNQGNYLGIARIAYVAAYPLLWTLPQRFPAPAQHQSSTPVQQPRMQEKVKKDKDKDKKKSGFPPERRRYSTEPKTFHSLLALAAETTANKLNHALTRAIAQAVLADLCFLIFISEEENQQLMIASGYDLIREENLEGASMKKDVMPMLANSLQRGRPLRLPASETSSDLKNLGDLLGLGDPGHLMCVPIITEDKQVIGGILLLSPYSNRLWSAEDQTFLLNIASSLVPIIQRGRQLASMEQENKDFQHRLNQERDQINILNLQNQELLNQIEALQQQNDSGSVQDVDITALLAVQEESEKTIARLQKELDELKKGEAGITADTPDAKSEAHLEKELRLSLEEAANLQNQLANAKTAIAELENRNKNALSMENIDVISSVSQELRQPMSSIVGYTDLLLGESVGILGALQRKFVERIKSSTERIGSLVEDLIQVTTLDTGLTDYKPEPIDLNQIIDNAVAYTSSLVREKNITMHLDLPKKMSPIYADREAIQQVLIHLLQNAGTATPVEGTIALSVQTKEEASDAFVLIQVSDTGGGISPGDLDRVFSRLYRADNVLIQGIGDTGVGLSIAKTLTEAQNGRIWVETEKNVGSTFNVLFPIATAANSQGKG